jgi:Ca2+/H+ antiporter
MSYNQYSCTLLCCAVLCCAGCSPFVVVVGWITGHDFTLDFDPFATLALTVSVMHANFVTSDARSHWLMVSHGGGGKASAMVVEGRV